MCIYIYTYTYIWEIYTHMGELMGESNSHRASSESEGVLIESKKESNESWVASPVDVYSCEQ